MGEGKAGIKNGRYGKTKYLFKLREREEEQISSRASSRLFKASRCFMALCKMSYI